jgi:hypothetical protein
LAEVRHLVDVFGSTLIEPPHNLTGSEAGPSELLHEPAHPFFIKSQKICGNCV